MGVLMPTSVFAAPRICLSRSRPSLMASFSSDGGSCDNSVLAATMSVKTLKCWAWGPWLTHKHLYLIDELLLSSQMTHRLPLNCMTDLLLWHLDNMSRRMRVHRTSD